MTHDMSAQIAACISLLHAGHTRQEIIDMGYAAAAVHAAFIATTQEEKG